MFENRIWKTPNVLQEDLDEHIDNQSSSDDNLASYRLSDVFASYVKKNVSHDFYENDMDSDEEIWNNISIDDINLDLQTGADTTDNIMHVENVPNKNVKLGTLLIWFFMFLCTWQAVSALPDSAMNNLLSFLWTFFSEESVICSSLAAVFPGSVYLLWKKVRSEKKTIS